jgi:hypothetical protein
MWFMAAAAAALIGGGAAAYEFRWFPPTAAKAPAVREGSPAASKIALSVNRKLDDLEISWNRDADVVRTATAGALTIHNGPVTRTVPVNGEQLRQGSVVYLPISGLDSDFRLDIWTAEGSIQSEAVRVLGFVTAPRGPVPAPPPANSKPEFEANDAPTRPEGTADRADTSRPKDPAPGRESAHREAVAILRVDPKITSEVADEMRHATGKVSVSVLVGIDAAGGVDTAKVVGSTGEPSPSGPYIRLAALNAARQWKFRPAEAAGRPTPSKLTLLFSF